MNCPCDELIFPPKLVIPAGLSRLPRQVATFPEFRAAMLSAIPAKAALKDWRARGVDDFGVMVLEMWSYVCDSISFYDEAIACENYLRTAELRPSLRKLVALLGYRPRPAVAAKVELAMLAEGRQPVALLAGTGFRSGAFPGGSPQVFEMDSDARAHPFTNKWTLARTRGATFDPGPFVSSSRSAFLLDPKSVHLKTDQVVLAEDLADQSETRARKVESLDDVSAVDGVTYKELTLSASVPIPGSTAVASVRLTAPGQTGTIWKQPLGFFPSGLVEFFGAFIVFDSLHRDIQLGDKLVLEKPGELRWFRVVDTGELFADLPAAGDTTITDSGGKVSTVSPPPAQTLVTWVQVDVSFNDASRRDSVSPAWTAADASYIKVHFDFKPAGTPVVPADPTLEPGAPMKLLPPVEAPQDGKAPSSFLLEDKDSVGVELEASINFGAATLTPTVPLTEALVAPVTAYGNIVKASRGETVPSEVLGNGDASLSNQTFKLKKSPLTYFPAADGVTSTLKIYVDGLQWTEAPSFFGIQPEDQVYIVRQNDDGESLVTFGDGIRGRRLRSGVGNVIATYRFGAGKASPPAGSIHQMSKPVKGITGVRNPVAASGGDDAEPQSGLRTYAPRSALLLGRAISIPDLEAAAASVPGVRAVRAEWRWNQLRQRPLVQVWYLGAATVKKDVIAKLNGLSDSVTPIEADQAASVPATLSLSIEIDPKRIEADVLAAVRQALMNTDTGLLAPERIGIGLALFRSRIFDAVLAVPGAVAVTGLMWNGRAFSQYGISAGSGKYFDLEKGSLLLNGKAAS